MLYRKRIRFIHSNRETFDTERMQNTTCNLDSISYRTRVIQNACITEMCNAKHTKHYYLLAPYIFISLKLDLNLDTHCKYNILC